MGLPHHEALDLAARDAGFASYAIALRALLRPANNNEAEAPPRKIGRKTLLTQAREAFEAGDNPSANALARRVQKNNSRELAAYAIIARTQADDFERRWILLKAERAAQKLITCVPITEPGFMDPQQFEHFATNRALLARDYWREGPRQNKHLAIDLCKEVLWRDVEDPNGLRFDYYEWCMEMRAHTAAAGMLDLRGPRDLPLPELVKMISLVQARGDHMNAERLVALAAELA
ncbi:MAG: hypothetical protein ABT10_21115 [Novosphingobium sp. SCN 63-17]|nr:MAG: hypothetical protein ABT10_21115 [Novosphingobium sp. SCN 63-17]OJX93232.1 MAG: hypothetical protein BGP00_06235 [Novosphingobium sp. 63-713]